MHTITVDPQKCKGDGLCAAICPARVFRAEEAKKPPQVVDGAMCVLCGQCLAVCPHDAIAHSALDAARLEKIQDRQPVAPDAALDFLRQRRSVRAYEKKPVPRELLERIVRVAGFAPTSAHGGKGWVRSVAVVTGEKPMRRVAELTAEHMRRLGKMMDSPFARVIAHWKVALQSGREMLPDLRMRVAEWDAGRNAITYDAPAALFVHTPRREPEPEATCHAALMAILYAAHAHGLGTCWNGWLANAASAFKTPSFTAFREWLQLPDDHDVLAAATIGYPRFKLHSLPPRETRIRWIDSC
jgi:nitroreductase/NAD-dependent dihydropyrimidine dehydrogenase PreA subunit